MHDAIANGTYLCIPFKERGKGQMTEKNPKMVKETRDIDHDLLAFDLKEHF